MVLQTKTIGDLIADFIERYCVHTIGEKSGEPFILEGWQRMFVDDLYTMYWDATRRKWAYLYQSALLGVPRGAGKSTLSAAIALAELSPMPWNTEAPRVLLSAVSRENAMQVYGPAADMVHMSPKLQDFLAANKNSIWCTENRGELKRVSADGKGQFGHIPSFIVRDELHAWVTDKHVALSEALQTSLAKRWNARSLTATTAGHDKQTILGMLYDDALRSEHIERPYEGLTVVRDYDKRFLMHWYEAPQGMDIEDPATWRAAHPASWIDEEAVRAQLNDPSISPDEFQRQWLNRWSKSKKAWFEIGVWRALKSALTIPRHPGVLREDEVWEKPKVVVAVDGGWTDDCTAVSIAYCTGLDEPVVVRSRVWGTREDTAHDIFVPGGTMDMSLVFNYILYLSEFLQIEEVAYDPTYFHETAKKLSDVGFICVDFPKSGPQMEHAVMDFYRDVNSKKITHNGDQVLSDHVESVAAVETERGFKIFKLKQSRKIDACVATIMSTSRAKAEYERSNYSYAYRRKEKDVQAEGTDAAAA